MNWFMTAITEMDFRPMRKATLNNISVDKAVTQVFSKGPDTIVTTIVLQNNNAHNANAILTHIYIAILQQKLHYQQPWPSWFSGY